MAKPKHRKNGVTSPRIAADDAFWTFSLALYGRPGIAPALLRLQDRNGLDVNLLLLCCFVGARGLGALTKAELAQANRRVRTWREGVVQPLRAVRRALKLPPLAMSDSADGALRRQVAQAELLSERCAQTMLATWLATRKKLVSGEPGAAVALSLER
jgi:uncharacterized protein (TIGR02444 family)